MLHDQKNEEPIKTFFQEVYEVYFKHIFNPFYERGLPIKESEFEQKIRQIYKKTLEK